MNAIGRPGARRVQQAAGWGKKKYAGSWAEDVCRRLAAMDFMNRGMLFAATLLLCFFPFLIVASALAGRSVVHNLARATGLNSQAAAAVGHLFASSAATANAVVGTTSMVFFVLGGVAAASALQEIYERAFGLPHRGLKDVLPLLAWLAVLIGALLLAGWAGPRLRHAGGSPLLVIAGLVWATGFWWLTMRILLARRISWRKLFPPACATGVFYVGMEVFFSLFFSGIVISDEHKFGPIGIIFALLTYLIAIGVVIILGAVAGLVWQERGRSVPSVPAVLRKRRPGWAVPVPGIVTAMSTLTPHLVTRDPDAAAAWYRSVLGAVEDSRITLPGGQVLTIELRFGDSPLAIADEFPDLGIVSPLTLGGTYGALHVAVTDADAVWQRALDAGATVFEPLHDAFWGDRTGQFIDPFGHRWAIDQHLRDVPPDEVSRLAAAAFGPGEG